MTSSFVGTTERNLVNTSEMDGSDAVGLPAMWPTGLAAVVEEVVSMVASLVEANIVLLAVLRETYL